VVLNRLAMEYMVSPALTVYVVEVAGGGVVVVPGIFKTWPIRSKLTLTMLLAAASLATVVLNRLAMEYMVSPALTVYVEPLAGGGAEGNFSNWETVTNE